MFSLLLAAIIYIAFISLGLPDSMLGAAWPMMYADLNVPISYAGFISMTVCGGTVVSSIMYSRLARRIPTGIVTAVSVAMTALALMGFSFASSFPMIIALAVILGLGAGAVDAGLNNYVAIHFKARAMSFLHASWGIGTTVGPFLLSYLISIGLGWQEGYRILSTVQFTICIMLFASLPLWKKAENAEKGDTTAPVPEYRRFCKGAVIPTILAFFAYCSMENTAMIWSATFLVEARGFSEGLAAVSAGVLFWGMTAGRLFSGFISDRLGDRKMLAIGETASLIAILLIAFIPGKLSVAALFLLGFGFGPIYPSMIHQTPEYFGVERSSEIMGLEMASAYVGSMFMPPVFGLIGRRISMDVFPLFALFFLILHTAAIILKRRALEKDQRTAS